MKVEEIVRKIYRVIWSCKTTEQLYYAHIYLELAQKHKYIAPELKRAIYFDAYIKKLEELE
jgi:hypothetical protein